MEFAIALGVLWARKSCLQKPGFAQKPGFYCLRETGFLEFGGAGHWTYTCVQTPRTPQLRAYQMGPRKEQSK